MVRVRTGWEENGAFDLEKMPGYLGTGPLACFLSKTVSKRKRRKQAGSHIRDDARGICRLSVSSSADVATGAPHVECSQRPDLAGGTVLPPALGLQSGSLPPRLPKSHKYKAAPPEHSGESADVSSFPNHPKTPRHTKTQPPSQSAA